MALEQGQNGLRGRVGLGQSRSTGLNQDLRFAQNPLVTSDPKNIWIRGYDIASLMSSAAASASNASEASP